MTLIQTPLLLQALHHFLLDVLAIRFDQTCEHLLHHLLLTRAHRRNRQTGILVLAILKSDFRLLRLLGNERLLALLTIQHGRNLIRQLRLRPEYIPRMSRLLIKSARGMAMENRPAKRDMLFAIPDRKSTRLNSSHLVISYAVFC